MDADDLAPETYADVIADLARVNTITLARPMTLAWLARATRGLDSFSVVDVGFGHGDMLRAIAGWANTTGKAVHLVGVDRNPRSAPVADAATDPMLGIDFRTGDAQALDFAPDFIISSLVAHHMTDAELADFLRWMEATAQRGWHINDLHRNRIAWAGFRVLAKLLRWHPIVRHDGALSVRRAFIRADWKRLLAAAGLAGLPVTLRWHPPFRWGVGRIK
ncbi:methyltransferase domain-containing protein [Polymorphobacter fuscus]|uniref:Methyltransferase domain-containing protein n=2 Tax=Sandarakinorhabdus fusca TaxID=1439888 RepID=A0A7C9KJE9_9SPHN|nr:methyltransferase domain-containing protein [Polymorphobacter fuscus]MQT17981.1 methyltransferase domain-containing protein [Polymorphobacter fuscus]